MGEDSSDIVLPITVTKPDNDTLRVTSTTDGTYVDFGARVFSRKFYTPTSVLVATVTSISASGKEVTVQGILTDGEGIYGGGERLDVDNKRGTAFNLFTCDGWNNSATTYVVIPLFLSTRGGGMFFNRNEFSRVDFGKATENVWSYEVQYADIDCYFYPTGNMADALRGYTELAGHASMPSSTKPSSIALEELIRTTIF